MWASVFTLALDLANVRGNSVHMSKHPPLSSPALIGMDSGTLVATLLK